MLARRLRHREAEVRGAWRELKLLAQGVPIFAADVLRLTSFLKIEAAMMLWPVNYCGPSA